jgi:arylsulfatase A-like enzyme
MTRALLAVLLALLFLGSAAAQADTKRPNVLLLITDDQGHGDLGCHGNPIIRTPHLDRLAQQGVQLTSFYVMPVCSPTRACLLTGRYNYRTGVVDTFLGRSLMHPDEVTLAELLGAAGYRTGIFGKWHLGDNYPMRPIDQGFQEALVLKGGGIGQPSDPPGGSSYFDPILQHNGKPEKTKGYCSDVFTDAAIRFIEQQREQPFFVYLAFNAPHAPLQVPDRYYEPYRKRNLKVEDFPAVGHPIGGKFDPDVTARVYGMVTNIDDNLGRLFARLDELKLADDTIVIFLTDNGPQQPRYNSGMLQRKGSVHEGGIRVPCFVRWPAQLPAGRKVERIAAHIDIAPTLLDACGVKKPAKLAFDGTSLLPLLKGEKVDWPDRTLYFQWHRGDVPQLYCACAARSQKYKLVQPLGAADGKAPAKPVFKLYDMEKDPLEMRDIADQHPDIVAKMRQGYEAWFKDVSSTRGYAPPRIRLGSPHENPSTLTRQDWRGPRAGWAATSLGHWEVEVERPGTYTITLTLAEAKEGGTAHFALLGVEAKKDVKAGARECTFEAVKLPAGAGKLEAWLAQGKETVGVQYVEVKRVD